MSSLPGGPHPTPPSIVAALRLVAAPAVCRTLRTSGVLDRLVDRPSTASELSTTLGVDVEGLGRLLAAAERLGVVERRGDSWATPVSREALANADRVWGTLDGVLAGGPRPFRSDDARQAGASYATVVTELADLYGDLPARLTAMLPPVAGRILDVGAGAAPWSIAMIGAWPAADAIALDLPGVVGVTRRAVAAHGLDHRVEVLAGDVWTAEPGRDFQLIVVAGVCHLLSVERVEALLARLVSWLADGGRLVILDGGGPTERPCDGALHDLSLWLRSRGGRRDAATHLRWLVNAGLSGATELDLGRLGFVAVTATLDEHP